MSREIYISTNVSCNLRCRYCYENKDNDKSFDLEFTKRYLNKILSSPTSGGTTINLHGGEPILVFEKLKLLYEWCKDQAFPEKFRFFATTNGTLIHGEIKNWFKERRADFILGLSLDGTPEMHNLNRSNSYSLIDKEFFVENYPLQGVKMTISPLTLPNLSQGIIHLHEIGFKEIHANLAEMTNWDTSLVTLYERELKRLINYYLQHPHLNIASLLKIDFKRVLVSDSTPQKWCGIGEMEAWDVLTEKTYPCHLMFPSVCGVNNSNEALNFDFFNPTNLVSEECKDCKFLNICQTCYASNKIVRGNFRARDMNLCKFQKTRFKMAAYYNYYKILEDAKTIEEKDHKIRKNMILTLEALENLLPYLNEINESSPSLR